MNKQQVSVVLFTVDQTFFCFQVQAGNEQYCPENKRPYLIDSLVAFYHSIIPKVFNFPCSLSTYLYCAFSSVSVDSDSLKIDYLLVYKVES